MNVKHTSFEVKELKHVRTLWTFKPKKNIGTFAEL